MKLSVDVGNELKYIIDLTLASFMESCLEFFIDCKYEH